MVVGDITKDCTDLRDTSTLSETYGTQVVPLVSSTSSSAHLGNRVGISFPYFSGDNMIPRHPWTSVGAYPAS